MQRLVKAKYNEKFSIRIINKLEKEIENKIVEVFPDTLKLDISNPCNPTITIIANNISTDTQKKIDKLLSSYFRCYTKSEIKKSYWVNYYKSRVRINRKQCSMA